jgi:hypothetical protein
MQVTVRAISVLRGNWESPNIGAHRFGSHLEKLGGTHPLCLLQTDLGSNVSRVIGSPVGSGTHATLGYSKNRSHIGGTLTATEGSQSANLALVGSGGTLVIDPPAQTSPQNPLNNIASLFIQFISSWTNPSAALTGQTHLPPASELETAISLPQAHG